MCAIFKNFPQRKVAPFRRINHSQIWHPRQILIDIARKAMTTWSGLRVWKLRWKVPRKRRLKVASCQDLLLAEEQAHVRMSKFSMYIKEKLLLAVIELAAEKNNSSLNLSNFHVEEIPGLLFQLRHLTKLYLNNNALKTLPETISDLKHLRVLTLDYNMLTSVPSSIARLTDLVCLNLSYNNLGHLLPELGLLANLQVLWCNHAHLESFPPEIGNCIYLDTLGARGNFIRELPPEIGKLHRLRWLTLEGNLLSRVPQEMQGLCRLVHLNLSNNRFESFPEISALYSLQFVFLSRNFITDIDIASLERLAFVKKIDLTDNPISRPRLYESITNLKLDTSAVEGESEFEDTDSEDWEESAPSSDLDLSESSVEGLHFDDILEAALPHMAKFTATGI